MKYFDDNSENIATPNREETPVAPKSTRRVPETTQTKIAETHSSPCGPTPKSANTLKRADSTGNQLKKQISQNFTLKAIGWHSSCGKDTAKQEIVGVEVKKLDPYPL
jgi:hypothetical protein